MNRLKKILLSFILPFFCLLISVSTAEIPANTVLSFTSAGETTSTSDVNGLTYKQLNALAIDYIDNGNQESMDTLFEAYKTIGCTSYFWNAYTDTNGTKYRFVYFIKEPVDIGLSYSSDDGSLRSCIVNTEYDTTYGSVIFLRAHGTGSNAPLKYSGDNYTRNYVISKGKSYEDYAYDYYFPEDIQIKKIEYSTVTQSYSWDGVSYVTEHEEPDTPSLPSNAEIAQAVQAFYDSDYYKNNKDFSDFIVMYNYDTQYFSFIGHNYEDKFQQLIFPAGYKYNQQWWKFGLDGLTTELSSYIFDKYYWLYSTNDFGENFSYDGKGLLSNLLELNFSTSSTIVYSTNEYDVVVYSYNENNELTSEMDTMPGDQYTYDENLDPTTNEYNPLENFIPTNPSQSILGDVDFDEINKTFEENKDILNIENASWLFTANNQLTNYFIGFLSLLIVFLIISRILGG